MVKKGKGRIRSRLIICAAAMGLVLGFAASGEATTYTFTKIAETSSAQNGFSALNIPSLSDNGTAAFSARLNSTLIGIFIGDGTTTANPIVDTSGPSSNFGFSFTILGSPSINNTGMVAFWARLNDGSNGIFRSDGTAATTIPDTIGPFSSFDPSPSINDAGMVAFRSNIGVFTGSGGSTTTIADTSDRFSSLSFPSIANTGTVAFGGRDADGSGIFMGDGTTTTTVVASGTFTALSFPVTNNGGTVTFLGFLNGGGSGIFSSNGGTLTSIADTSGPFTFFGTPSINDAGVVAFQAFISTGAGIFSGPDPIADRVIAVGDPLDGSTVAGLAFSREGLNGAGQVAFFASLADGRQGVFLADPGDGGDPMPTPDPAPLPNPAPSSDPPSEIEVSIDIKPGGDMNSVNPTSNGVVRVAILGAANFDALNVNPESVNLSGAHVKQKGNGMMAWYKDVNGDGYLDLVVHVETEYIGLTESDTEAVLTGYTYDGMTMIRGSDSVNVVP